MTKELVKIKIHVTSEDLKYPYLDGLICPIAQAVRRSFPNRKVVVYSYEVNICGIRISLPSSANIKAQKRAGQIDGMGTPFSFTLKFTPEEYELCTQV